MNKLALDHHSIKNETYNPNTIIEWLLEGDVSIQYQVYKDLLSENRNLLRNRISTEGWGKQFLSKRKNNAHWGKKFYQPKWTSTHYTLLDLRNLCIDPLNSKIQESISIVLKNEKADDGGILPIGKFQLSDLCINGMFLNYASYFKTKTHELESIVDCILNSVMPDGGFNCFSNRYKTKHSSFHTTISVLEGITEYEKNGYTYRLDELIKAKKTSIELLLKHQLFLSDNTGQIIKEGFLKLTYPSRWRYDILRALDYFQHEGVSWDERMSKAIGVLLKKRKKNHSWNLQAQHPGVFHFHMEKAGKASRWNTLRALRVLNHFNINEQ